MKCSSNTDNFFQTSNKLNFPVEYLVTEQGNSCDLGTDVEELSKAGMKPVFSLKWKKAIPGKLQNAVSLLSFQIKCWEIGKKKALENRVSWECWKITFLIEFPASSWSAELACALMLHVLWVRNNSAGWTWVILGWFCVLHPEAPSTVYTCVFTVSWWWRSWQSFCIADTQNSILPSAQVLWKISDSHFFPSLKKILKLQLVSL